MQMPVVFSWLEPIAKQKGGKKAQGNQYQLCATGKWWSASVSLPEDMTKGNLSPAAIKDDYKSYQSNQKELWPYSLELLKA